MYTWYGFYLVGQTSDSAFKGGVWVALIVGGTGLTPAVVWIVLWASRRWPHTRWLTTLTWPVWGLVQLSLHRARIEQRRDYDRFVDERTADLANAISHKTIRSHRIRAASLNYRRRSPTTYRHRPTS
jgi:hypothetical protein